MLLVSRTPLRISLFGGGTDYPAYFEREPGAVLGLAVQQHIYISALSVPPEATHHFRVTYSRLETVQRAEDIMHPVVREALKFTGYDIPTDFSIQADMPANTGLGSSSAFTVGFLNLLYNLQKNPRDPMALARDAMYTEQVLLAERVGVQDQLHTAFGGMNRFDFHGNDYRRTQINAPRETLDALMEHCLLVYTGIRRHASNVVAEQVEKTSTKTNDSSLAHLVALVGQAQALLENSRSSIAQKCTELGAMLHDSWMVKKSLSSLVSLPEIDELYEHCMSSGALGGKLCGAGGGGFLFMVLAPGERERFVEAVGRERCHPVSIDYEGSVVAGFHAHTRPSERGFGGDMAPLSGTEKKAG
jgi:D-glycero-alpha-D-manno-heptose-7-phosphate kinase